ncbi:MAG: glutamine-hydrolyzing carbamoyl-phosphate synthase small subunit [Candidatus Firestonebacteria bacterium]
MKSALALEDGLFFVGKNFGAIGESYGEVVFNTSMTGYQEILTDPSYHGQIVTMTYPMIGNYGVNKEDVESSKPQINGFVVKECSKIVSNYRAEDNLSAYLKKHNIIGLEGIDTRKLTKHIRTYGAKKGIISTLDLDKKRLVKKAKNSPSIVGIDLVKDVTCKKSYKWDEPPLFLNKEENKDAQLRLFGNENRRKKYSVVVIDCGVKFNILKNLVLFGCDVTVVPATTKADEILSLTPNGVLLSNGPGDPKPVTYVVDTVKRLIGKIPIFGICLGHQMLGLAFSGKTYKLKFGHRGGNQPVMRLSTRSVEITSQNHGFAVDLDSIPDKNIKQTYVNLNDRTCEGLEHTKLPIFSVQYHPESSPGPHDSSYLFKKFVDMMSN